MSSLKYLFLFLSFIYGPTMMIAQEKIQAGSMHFEAWLVDETIEIQIEAATTGWLAVGFNRENNIVHSDLLQFRISGGKVYAEDQYVTGPGQHPTDVSLGGSDKIEIITGEEKIGITRIRFRIPFRSSDRFDFIHQLEKDFWLILAYSREKDFQHHSIMRKHFPYRWTKD